MCIKLNRIHLICTKAGHRDALDPVWRVDAPEDGGGGGGGGGGEGGAGCGGDDEKHLSMPEHLVQTKLPMVVLM